MLLRYKTNDRWTVVQNPNSKWPRLTGSKQKKDATKFSSKDVQNLGLDLTQFKVYK